MSRVQRIIADWTVFVLSTGDLRRVTARAMGDLLNAEFACSPVTRSLVLRRLDVEAALGSDGRLVAHDGHWSLAAGADVAAPCARAPLCLSPRRPGKHLTLHAWQREALGAWKAAGRRGIVEAVTGSGKTCVGLAAIAAHVCEPAARAAVVVPTIELMEQWFGQLHEYLSVPIGRVGGGHSDRFDRCAVIVYVAASAADALAPDALAENVRLLLVADECHRYGSVVFARAIAAPAEAALGLSATPERSGDDGMGQHVIPKLGTVVYRYDHERGVAAGVVSDFRVCFVGLAFERVENDAYDALTAEIRMLHGALVREYPFLERADPLISAVKALAALDEPAAKRYLSLTAQRNRLLHSARARYAFMRWLAESERLRDDKILVFHQTIADAEALAQMLSERGIPSLAHHSELSADARAAALASFARGAVRALVAPRTLDEGVDVPDASVAIIVAGSRVKRQAVQRIGRVLRVAPGKKTARVFKLFMRGARDDPRRAAADAFSRELLASGRAVVVDWPAQPSDVLAFLEGCDLQDAVRSRAGRERRQA